jgi:hypothetical protein
MPKHRYPALNSGGLLALIFAGISFYVCRNYESNVDGFRMFCALLGCLFGGLAWVSFRKYGLWIVRVR